MKLPGLLALDYRRPGAGRLSLAGLTILCLGLAAAGWQTWRYLDAQTKVAARSERLVELRRNPARGLPAADTARREALRPLDAPWQKLLGDLAGAAGPDLALLALEAEGGRGVLRLTGEAASLEAVLAYVQRLSKLPSVSHPELISHDMKRAEDQSVVGFTIHAGWGAR